MIDVERIVIARETCEQHDVGFRHRPSRARPLVADDQVVE
jgi:hypothetical protein